VALCSALQGIIFATRGLVHRFGSRKIILTVQSRLPLGMVRSMNNSIAKPTIISNASPAKPQNSDRTDRLDVAGQNVLAMIEQAADLGEDDYNHALDIAHKLSHQLKSAEQRIKDLELEIQYHQHRADRAEKWLVKIAEEIEQKFFRRASEESVNASNASQRKP
jgi:hypothetical protein